MARHALPGWTRKAHNLLTLLLMTACTDPAPEPVAKDAALASPDVPVDAPPPADSQGSDAAVEVQDIVTDLATAPEVAQDIASDVPLPIPPTDVGALPEGVTHVPLLAGVLDEQGKSAQAKLKLGKDTIGVVVVVRGQHPGFYGVSTIVSPMGDLLAKGQCAHLCLTCPNRIAASAATGSALFPNASAVALLPGNWNVGACAFQYKKSGSLFAPSPLPAGAFELSAFVKSAPGGKVPAQGRLALRLFLSGAGGVTAAQAATHPRIQGMVAEAGKVLAKAGISLEIVAVADLPSGHQTVVLPDDVTVSAQGDLDLLIAEAAGMPSPVAGVLDVFLVGHLLGGGAEQKGMVAGLSGGIPGPVFFHGVPLAGVTVALEAVGDDTALSGHVLAHEVGHFLGLWHVTESEGAVHDPLDDTPDCPKLADADFSGTLSTQECAGQGGDNVMFWLAGSKTPVFSPQQGEVLRRSPLVLPAAASPTNP